MDKKDDWEREGNMKECPLRKPLGLFHTLSLDRWKAIFWERRQFWQVKYKICATKPH